MLSVSLTKIFNCGRGGQLSGRPRLRCWGYTVTTYISNTLTWVHMSSHVTTRNQSPSRISGGKFAVDIDPPGTDETNLFAFLNVLLRDGLIELSVGHRTQAKNTFGAGCWTYHSISKSLPRVVNCLLKADCERRHRVLAGGDTRRIKL